MLSKLNKKHFQKLESVMNNYKYNSSTIITNQVLNIYDEPQDWEELHIDFTCKNTDEKLTLIFDYFGLVNLIKDNQKLLTENDQMELLRQHPNLIEITNTFTEIMLGLYKKQYFHQSKLLRNCHENFYSKQIAEYTSQINELQIKRLSDEKRITETQNLIAKQSLAFEYRAINEKLKTFLYETYSELEKK